MGTATDEQFCLRWNDFQQCIKTTFTDLRDESEFMDVTLSCDGGEQVKAHKVILSACSVTFRALLKKNPAQNPVIVLWDVLPRDLAAILDFMYHGEVNVKQDHLNSFLAVAEKLRVRGLCQNDGQPSSSSSQPSSQVVEKSQTRLAPPDIQTSSPEPQAKRPRSSHPVAHAATPIEDDDEVEELPQPQVKLEIDRDRAPVKMEGSDPGPLRRVSAQHYPVGGQADQQHYPMAETGYDESMQGSEYGDYSGYEDDMSYMEGGGGMGADQSQGGKEETYCYDCCKMFKAVSSYRRHMRDYHTNIEAQFQCEFCEKMFKTKGLMINHKSAEHRAHNQSVYVVLDNL